MLCLKFLFYENNFFSWFQSRLPKTISYKGNIRPPLSQVPFCQTKLHFYWGMESFLRTILFNSPTLNKEFLNFFFEMFLLHITRVCFILAYIFWNVNVDLENTKLNMSIRSNKCIKKRFLIKYLTKN